MSCMRQYTTCLPKKLKFTGLERNKEQLIINFLMCFAIIKLFRLSVPYLTGPCDYSLCTRGTAI